MSRGFSSYTVAPTPRMLPLSAAETQRVALLLAQDFRTTTLPVMRKILLFLIALAAGFAAPSKRAAAQQVQGQVVDSVTGQALLGAAVFLLDLDGSIVATTLTDSDGVFLLLGPGPDSYSLRVEHEGYRTSLFPQFELPADQSASYRLRLPRQLAPAIRVADESLLAMIPVACPNTSPEEPVVLGWVHRSKTRAPIPDAAVLVSWSHVPDALRGTVDVGYFEGITTTDSAGFYAICGAPTGSRIAIHAVTDQGLSGFHQLRFVGSGVVTDDQVYLTSGPVWRQDLMILELDQRSTNLVGVVTDSVTGEPLPDAEVEVVGTPLFAVTDGTGHFRLEALSFGPVRLRVRHVGNLPLEHAVTLPETGTLEIPREALVLPRVPTELEPVVVEAVPGRSPFAEFEARRERGAGSFITREEFMARGDPARVTDVLRGMPGIELKRGPDLSRPWIVSLRRGGPRTFGNAVGGTPGSSDGCWPLFYLDRHYIGNAGETDVDMAVSLPEVEAIEVYGGAASIPHDFNRIGAQCGVIAFWTRQAEPRTVPVEGGGGILSSPYLHFGFAAVAVVAIFLGLGHAIHF